MINNRNKQKTTVVYESIDDVGGAFATGQYAELLCRSARRSSTLTIQRTTLTPLKRSYFITTTTDNNNIINIEQQQ
jgi:hypothetical protein